ncbi:MAG TPA: hypothetical protein VKU60_01840 [Chloroflexota bacterium]|nr:hypothetical protein [Chloroflexota bacterium]
MSTPPPVAPANPMAAPAKLASAAGRLQDVRDFTAPIGSERPSNEDQIHAIGAAAQQPATGARAASELQGYTGGGPQAGMPSAADHAMDILGLPRVNGGGVQVAGNDVRMPGEPGVALPQGGAELGLPQRGDIVMPPGDTPNVAPNMQPDRGPPGAITPIPNSGEPSPKKTGGTLTSASPTITEAARQAIAPAIKQVQTLFAAATPDQQQAAVKQIGFIGDLATKVASAQSPDEKSQAWDSAIDHMVSAGMMTADEAQPHYGKPDDHAVGQALAMSEAVRELQMGA